MTELQGIYSSHMLLRSRRVELRPLNSTTLGQFQVPETLTFKSRLRENLSCENEFYLRENLKSCSCQWSYTKPRFETEALSNSEMAYWSSQEGRG